MKILLVSLFNDEAYGLRSLHAHLLERRVNAKMMFFKSPRHHGESQENKIKDNFIGDINTASQHEIDLFINHVIDNQYDLVGFSLVSQHFNLYKKLFIRLKTIENLIIVIGGWQASLNTEDSIQYTDYLCIGEGEEPLAELIGNLEKGIKSTEIENIWINSNGRIIKNSVRKLPKDLSSFPIPVYEDRYSYIIENDSLKNHEPYLDNPRYGTFIGRGCPYACTYCSNSYMANHIYPGSWSKIRYRDVGHVKSELLYVKENLLNVRNVNFYDEVFSPPLSWIKEFFTWYKKTIDIPFFCFFYPGTCSDEKAKILADSGMSGVWLGIQSGSERVRNEVFRRHYSNRKIIDQANIFFNHGISVRYDFIFDNPFETFDESLESISLMLDVPQPFSLNIFSLKFFPNTEITEMARARGFIGKFVTDDQRQEDHDFYLIRQNSGNRENKFINYLAYYITNICGSPILLEKKEIMQLAEDFKASKDLSEIEKLIRPYVQ
ncbi:MAG: B12-binding domain-containing radical SAM protein [Proteobacteria bacterium]|nr:B12-binding domain-containing radical SAM protein [Pseudomonadota bacterium]